MPHFTTCSCPSCHTRFTGIPLEIDEDGDGYAVLEVALCAEPHCGQLLCASCDQFRCDSCGGRFCLSHLAGRDRLNFCPACAAEYEPLPLPFSPVRESRPALNAEVA